ncbi:unnamed protein product, partial [Acidithrix sp. C25]
VLLRGNIRFEAYWIDKFSHFLDLRLSHLEDDELECSLW